MTTTPPPALQAVLCATNTVIPIIKGYINQSNKLWERVAWWLTCEANPEVHPISPQRVDTTLTHGNCHWKNNHPKISWKNRWVFPKMVVPPNHPF